MSAEKIASIPSEIARLKRKVRDLEDQGEYFSGPFLETIAKYRAKNGIPEEMSIAEWRRNKPDAYGRSPAMDALDDAQELQKAPPEERARASARHVEQRLRNEGRL
jgi:hypothetical protein